MAEIIPEEIPWPMPFSLNTFSRDLSAFVMNLYINVLVANVSLKTLRNITHTDTTLSVAQEKKICLDFVGPLKPTKKGYTSLLTVVDVYTRWFTAWPVKNQKAEKVIKSLV